MESVRLEFDVDAIPECVLRMKEAPHTRRCSVLIRARVAKDRCAEALNKHFRAHNPVDFRKTCYEIIKILPGKGDAPPKGESAERTMVCHVFIEAAEQIPYWHPAQTRLAQLMAALTGSPKTGTIENLPPKSGEIDMLEPMDGPRYRVEFEALKDAIMDRYKPPTQDPLHYGLDEPARLERAKRWINVSAFYANISLLGWSKTSPNLLPAVMGFAFGNFPPIPYDPGVDPYWRDTHVCAAAQWIIYSGQNIFRQVMNPKETLEAWERPLRIPLPEWQRWKEGFRDVINDAGRQDEARVLARRAANLMDCLEENMLPVLGGAQFEGGQSTDGLLAGSSTGMPDQPNQLQ